MAVIFTIPTKRYQNGTSSIGATALPAGSSVFQVVIDTSQMTLATQHLQASFDVSYDGGTTWQFLIGATIDGGGLDELGKLYTQSSFDIYLDPTSVNSTTRKFRGSYTISGGPYTMGGTVNAN